MDRPFLDTKEIATYLGINDKQVYTLIHDRGLPATKITGKWLFPRHLVDRWIEAHVTSAPPPAPFLEDAKGLLLIAGSDDPLLDRLLNLYRKQHPDVIVLRSRAGSSEGMLALRRGLCHIACVHLPHPGGGFSTDHVTEVFGPDVAAVTFANRKQGLLLPAGNPHHLSTLQEAIAADLRWALREPGTGTRALFEKELDRLGNDPAPILHNALMVDTHLEAGLAVYRGESDVGMGIEAAARLIGLDFLPLQEERFDFVIQQQTFFTAPVQNLLALLSTPAFADLAARLGGYDIAASGRIITS
ncbi:helix-turn-helix transcriptional regulator [Candidatus Entotheonella palauensis]|nr:helix-turn-helix transcriptional regulator [Candidatus Entotheonella palauensis]